MVKAHPKKETKRKPLRWLLDRPDPLIWFLLAMLFFFLALLSWYSRPTEISNLIKMAHVSFNNQDYQTSFALLNQAALLDNSNPNIHFQLAKLYQTTNNWEEAKKELLLALEFSNNSKIITDNLMQVNHTLNEPGRIQEEINFWEKEVTHKPDYRDGYLQLAVRYYEIYNHEKAKLALSKAFSLDPNFEVTKKLMEIIKQ